MWESKHDNIEVTRVYSLATLLAVKAYMLPVAAPPASPETLKYISECTAKCDTIKSANHISAMV